MPKGSGIPFPDGVMPTSTSSSAYSSAQPGWGALAAFLRLLAAPIFYREYWLLNSLGFLLSRVTLMGELAPFGLAFFAAVAQFSGRRAGGVAFWMLMGVLSTGRYLETAWYLVAILLYFRLADKLGRLEKKLQAVPLFVFAAVILGEAPLALWQGATPYQLLVVLFNGLICMILAYLFRSGVYLLIRRPGEIQVTGDMLMCLAIVLSLAIAGVGGIMVAGYSLRNIAGSFAIMALAMAGGTGLGTTMGVVVGLTIGLTDNDATAWISLYAVAGLFSGSVRILGKFAVVLGFMLGAVITILHFGQAAAFARLLAETAVAAVFLMLIPVGRFRRWSAGLQEHGNEPPSMKAGIQGAVAKLCGVAEIFGHLAAASITVAGEADDKIRDAETARMLAVVGEQVCGPCPRRTGCWDYDFHRTRQSMLDALALAEQVDLAPEDMPAILRDNCLRGKEVVKAVNAVAQYNRGSYLAQKQFAAARQTLIEQLQALGNIVANLAKVLLQDENSSQAAAWPERTNSVHQVYEGQVGCSRAGRLSLQEMAGRFQIRTGAASAAKERLTVCGDTYAVFPIEKTKLALILSDGMGSGSQAAGQSAATVDHLEKLLQAGFPVDLAVKTVNDLLLLSEIQESFATLDIVIVDTCAGTAEFLKVGSAPSYVKRVHEVATIKPASLPVGILQQIEIEPIEWQLANDDLIVMVSDGVVDFPGQGRGRESWLVNFLRRTAAAHPQEMADKILLQAKTLCAGGIGDDMTVLVAQVTERPGVN
ncbi:MAG: SpoIIE family protein phosphatase [Negativicutes bacterium]|nr:SpoIIE family protein phosphatase [Negativicutes bacterium]